MTIDGALNEFNNLLKADDIPIYYKPSIKAVMETITMEIKPMSQEQSGDCISREAVMHILDEVGGDFDSPREAVVPIDYIADMVSELPPVTPQPNKWIPCSERLPEIHQDVILSLRSLDIEFGFRAETEPYFYCYGANVCYIEPQDVLAWMPLPEPYKTESEVK